MARHHHHHHRHRKSHRKHSDDPLSLLFNLSSLFVAAIALCFAIRPAFTIRWVISGAPLLTYSILLGDSQGHRILPFVPLWTIVSTLNLVYAVAATSWLLYYFFLAACYPTIFFSALFQFDYVANFCRTKLRTLLQQLQFVNDKIAFFDIPALEIDTDVDGLMVIRGITISLSSLTLVAHGIELGVKLSDDMELAAHCDKVTVKFFRKIEIGDVYANLKGGEYEMTFGALAPATEDQNGDALMLTDTPLLQAAVAGAETLHPRAEKMVDKMTDGAAPKDVSAQDGFDHVTKLTPDDEEASEKYRRTIKHIHDSSMITQSLGIIKKQIRRAGGTEEKGFDHDDRNDMRAGICSELHDKPTCSHPPRRSIKVTTLQNLSSPATRRFLHRLPMLLRLLLTPLSYFHPIVFESITAAASGKWVKHMLEEHVFKSYGEHDSEIRRLQVRIFAWLDESNFVLELAKVTGTAHVPFVVPAFDIQAHLGIDDIMAYRTLANPQDVDMKQVVRLGGADCGFNIPSFLLPHHEHLLPPVPNTEDEESQLEEVDHADGKPKTMQAQRELEQTRKDECNMKISAHVRLPAVFDQELLNFVSALVKATKVIEMEKEPSALHSMESHSLKSISKALHNTVKDNMKRAAVEAVANDKWIAKLVGKVMKKLEEAQGEVGYSGDIPISLEPYRAMAEAAPKLMA